MIFITHELPLLYNVTDDIMVMYAGQIVEKVSAKDAVFNPFHPYSQGLMGSIIVPESGVRGVQLTAIPELPPIIKDPPASCRFAERCKYARPDCKVISVTLRYTGNGRAPCCILPKKGLKEYSKREIENLPAACLLGNRAGAPVLRTGNYLRFLYILHQ